MAFYSGHISNDVGGVKSDASGGETDISRSGHRSRLSLANEAAEVAVLLSGESSAVSTSERSIVGPHHHGVCPPNISSVTMDHDVLCSLPDPGGG